MCQIKGREILCIIIYENQLLDGKRYTSRNLYKLSQKQLDLSIKDR